MVELHIFFLKASKRCRQFMFLINYHSQTQHYQYIKVINFLTFRNNCLLLFYVKNNFTNLQCVLSVSPKGNRLLTPINDDNGKRKLINFHHFFDTHTRLLESENKNKNRYIKEDMITWPIADNEKCVFFIFELEAFFHQK
jgi:hypothetical protein